MVFVYLPKVNIGSFLVIGSFFWLTLGIEPGSLVLHPILLNFTFLIEGFEWIICKEGPKF